MDNAPIHRKTAMRELVEETGNQVIFLPKYSPDLNDIEQDFSALKPARMYAYRLSWHILIRKSSVPTALKGCLFFIGNEYDIIL